MSLAPHILVVDDDPGITRLLCDYLCRFGMQALAAADGVEMNRQLAAQRVDLIVLDLMLPGSDGLELARRLREHSRVPIIVLTARCHAYDRVVGLELGADDYMSKPFEPRELVARIQSVLRRAAPGPAAALADTPPEHAECVGFDGWELRRSERRLTSPQGLVVALSDAEYRLLAVFLKSPRRVVSREQLMSQARGRAMEASERSIDLLVSRLRQKLQPEDGGLPLIKTVRGEGYVLAARSVQARTAASLAWSA